MGIRDVVRTLRERPDGENAPLALTKTARERIAAYREDREDDPVFRVETLPAEVGFKVKVGFETASDLPRREGYDQPVVMSDEDFERLRGYTIDVRDGRFVTFSNVSVHVSETPNPESRKFIVNRKVMTSGSATFTETAAEDAPPLVRMLFGVEGVHAVFLIDTFCSITRSPGADWEEVQAGIGRQIQAYFAHGGGPLDPEPPEAQNLGEVESRIVEILETTVRPAVQRDGGDIAFAGYEDGTVQLYMLGSCVGCPSSLATLKMGVENLLKDAIPEVREVVAIS
jgi:Fe-S cluster biogenesis protein NfuA